MSNSLLNQNSANSELSNPLWLLLALIFVLMLPLINVVFGKLTIYLLPVAYTLLVVFGVLAVSTSRRVFVAGLTLGLGLVVVLWINYAVGSSKWTTLLQSVLNLLFFALLLVFLGRNVILSKKVNLAVIFGVANGYVLIAAIFSIFYMLLDLYVPGSIISQGSQISDFDYLYFSFVTITTLGYGDISPATEAAKSLSILTALCGQLYLSLVVAVIVGKFISTFGIEMDKG